ncbi:hypothetical protein [uncultured Photobacterium sp.]|uniref:hypothetical protein n=1 Tax=uncultured Photobacterium sp. TaxID=173973 RepID=UPI00261D8E73|nr:hypothetical protein [uncultured Photobacterium sp.]
MKNFVASVVALIIGFFTLILAAVMGLFVGISALIARPFIKKKVAAVYEEVIKQQGHAKASNPTRTVIDGEYDDITDRSKKEPQSHSFRHATQL